MRVVHKDLKNGKIKLAVETLDDLWHLEHIVFPNDVVTAQTWRREEKADDKIRFERLEKRRVTLSLRVESVEFHKHSNRLRLLGTIIEGPDMGKHHSFILELGSAIAITKEWKSEDLQRIRDAVKASKRPRVLLVALDDSSADLALVRQYGLDEVGTISRPAVGKQYSMDNEAEEMKFFHKLAEAIKEIITREEIRTAIVGGPGFTKENFSKFLREKFPDLSMAVKLGDASSGGRAGLYEIVRRGLVEQVSQEDRLSLETSLVDQLMKEIATGKLATYGRAEIEHAASMGAIEKLLVADELLRSNRAEVEKVLEASRRTRAEVLVISTEHDAGKQLTALGGMAAILRFRIG